MGADRQDSNKQDSNRQDSNRQGANRPASDASIAELTAWAAKGKTVEVRDVRQAAVVPAPGKQDRREAPARPARRRMPAAWQIAVGGIALFVIGQFIASLLAMLAMVAFGVAVVAGAFALGRYSARR